MAATPKALAHLHYTQQMLDDAVAMEPTILLSVSGGKDSNVVADLVGRLKEKHPTLRIGGFFKYVVDGLEPIERPFVILSKRYDFPVFKFPSPMLSRLITRAVGRSLSHEAWLRGQETKEKEVEWAARVVFACHLSGIPRDKMWKITTSPCAQCKGTGRVDRSTCNSCTGSKIVQVRSPNFDVSKLVVHPSKLWVANGHRQEDSPHRRGWLSSFRLQKDNQGRPGRVGFDVRFRNLYPIAQWSTREVYSYVRHYKLPPAAYLGDGQATGVGLSIRCLQALQKHHPECLEQVLHEFPLMRAQLYREEQRAGKFGGKKKADHKAPPQEA